MYLEIDEDMPSHPKSTRLCAALQNSVAWAYMIKLWSWARKYQKDGDLSAYEPAEIEFAVGWTLADEKFYAAAVKVGFIDETKAADGTVTARTLHNWMKRTGGAIKRMDAEANAKREYRLHAKGKCGGAEACRLCAADADAGEREATASAGRPLDGDEDGGPMSPQDKTSQGKSSQDPDPSPSPEISGPDRAGARVSEPPPIPRHEIPRPFRPALRAPRVAAVTPHYLAVYNAYPKKLGKNEAAQLFQEIADDYPGGEVALSAAILGAFRAGMLRRHPYSGDDEHRPSLEKFLAGRRWEDDQSAPDDEPIRTASGRKPKDLPFA